MIGSYLVECEVILLGEIHVKVNWTLNLRLKSVVETKVPNFRVMLESVIVIEKIQIWNMSKIMVCI